MKLTMNFMKHFKMLSTLILISILFSSFLFYYYDSLGEKILLYLLIPFIVFFVAPVLYIHYNYYINSQGITYWINKNGLTIKTKKYSKEIDVNNIEEIVFYMTANRLKKSGYREFAFESYFYAKIKLRSKETFIITSLFSDKIDVIFESNFDSIKISKIKSFYPIINIA